MPKLHIAKMRFYILLLLAVFFIDTLSANASLHLPVSHEQGLAAEQVTMQHADADHGSASLAMAEHHEHQHAMNPSQADGHPQHDSKCSNCHDCLSCFSVLPLSLPQIATALPQRHQADSSYGNYYPPAIAQLQRPPILPLV